MKAAFAAEKALMVIADYTDQSNWIIKEFLFEIRQPNLPVNLFIPGNPAKTTIMMNGPITQASYLDALDKVGG